jgi:3-methyladenine DNA glycosylase AlkD
MSESKLKADKINKSANKGNSVIVKNLSLTAASFIQELEKLSDEKARKDLERYFKPQHRDHFIGVKNSVVNKLAGNFLEMPIKELEKMLNNDIHEVRAGAISIMDQLSRKKRTPEERRKELFDLFMKKTDRVNNWDLTDLGCMYMTGCYLFDKDRKVLYNLVKSENFWERRIAIVSTCYFIRQNDTA